MAIKVIKYRKRIARCDYCESKMQYEKEDVKTEQIGMNEYRSCIICPVCKEKVCVNNN